MGGGFRPDPHFRLDQIPEFEEPKIIIGGQFVLKGSFKPLALAKFFYVFRDFKVKGITSLAKACHENAVTGFRLFKGGYEHEDTMGNPCFSADFMQVVHYFFRGSPKFFGYGAVITLEKTRIDQLVNIIHCNADFFHETAYCLRDDLGISFIPLPAFFPYIIILIFASPVVINKIT